MFVSSLSAAEGTRLANFTSEKSVFINMHGQTLPLKRAFVAQQMPERKTRKKQSPIKGRTQIDVYDPQMQTEAFGMLFYRRASA